MSPSPQADFMTAEDVGFAGRNRSAIVDTPSASRPWHGAAGGD
jgi:hypothetical protein